MTWINPKTNWTTNDGLMNSDLNRIEGNTLYNYNNAKNISQRNVTGFVIQANCGSATGHPYGIRVSGGQCWADNADATINFNQLQPVEKVLNANDFVPGSSYATPCKAPGVLFANDTWYYLFVLQNPNTGQYDFTIDSNYAGINIENSSIETVYGFTMKRRIGAIKTTSIHAEFGQCIVPVDSRDQVFTVNGNIATISITTHDVFLWTLNDTNNVGIFPPAPMNTRAYAYIYSSNYFNDYLTNKNRLNLWDVSFGMNSISKGIEVYCKTTSIDWEVGDHLGDNVHLPIKANQIYAKGKVRTSPCSWNVRPIWYEDKCEIF